MKLNQHYGPAFIHQYLKAITHNTITQLEIQSLCSKLPHMLLNKWNDKRLWPSHPFLPSNFIIIPLTAEYPD